MEVAQRQKSKKYKLTQNQIILRERGKTDERRIIESTS